ncbi:MAG: glucose-1-phosphate cytidylyltransferase [candidate division WOR-3 bacterium]
MARAGTRTSTRHLAPEFVRRSRSLPKVVILCGGQGTRLAESTELRPKPMVEIGEHPLLWHIMKIYAAHGFREFVLALGYKGQVIKDFFVNYRYQNASLSLRLGSGRLSYHTPAAEDWTVHLLDTGLNTNTGGRIRQASRFVGNQSFMLTYGDGVGNIDLGRLLQFHRRHGRLATVTAVRPPARFGSLSLDGELVVRFAEKSQADQGWINGGFFVLEPGAVNYIKDDNTLWEGEPLERLAADRQLVAYRHDGFWQCMDTLRDVRNLSTLWTQGQAPWKIWP